MSPSGDHAMDVASCIVETCFDDAAERVPHRKREIRNDGLHVLDGEEWKGKSIEEECADTLGGSY